MVLTRSAEECVIFELNRLMDQHRQQQHGWDKAYTLAILYCQLEKEGNTEHADICMNMLLQEVQKQR
jgi:hypothetical protein